MAENIVARKKLEKAPKIPKTGYYLFIWDTFVKFGKKNTYLCCFKMVQIRHGLAKNYMNLECLVTEVDEHSRFNFFNE